MSDELWQSLVIADNKEIMPIGFQQNQPKIDLLSQFYFKIVILAGWCNRYCYFLGLFYRDFFNMVPKQISKNIVILWRVLCIEASLMFF